MMNSLGTIILAGIGAFIANFAAKFLEAFVRRGQATEAQRDADLQDLIAAARSLAELAEKYWTKSANDLGADDQIIRAHMIAQQHNIAELVTTLFVAPAKYDCDVQVHLLFIAATGGDCGEPDREAEVGRLTEILIAIHRLTHIAKAARRKLRRNFLA